MHKKIKKINKFVDIITGTNVIGITLAPFGIFLKEKYLNDQIVINHELIHYEQQKELLFIFFYILYFLEWFIKFFFYGKRAYHYISFEKEANEHEKNNDYFYKRRKYAWVKEIL